MYKKITIYENLELTFYITGTSIYGNIKYNWNKTEIKRRCFPSKLYIQQNFEPYAFLRHHTIFTSSTKLQLYWQFRLISLSSWHLYAANTFVYYFPVILLSLNSIALQFVAVETNWISNILVLFTSNMGDQDHNSFF